MKFHISQNTPVVIITNAVKGNSNCEKHLDEIHDNNEDTIEDGVRNIRGDIVIEKNPFSDFIGQSGMILMM